MYWKIRHLEKVSLIPFGQQPGVRSLNCSGKGTRKMLTQPRGLGPFFYLKGFFTEDFLDALTFLGGQWSSGPSMSGE